MTARFVNVSKFNKCKNTCTLQGNRNGKKRKVVYLSYEKHTTTFMCPHVPLDRLSTYVASIIPPYHLYFAYLGRLRYLLSSL